MLENHRAHRHGPCCDMRGMLSFLVLFLLSRRPMHGQELAKELERRKGEKPSPGTIYPALKALKEAGLIKESTKEGRRQQTPSDKEPPSVHNSKAITYSLTAEGQAVLKQARKRFCRTFEGVYA